MESSQLVLLILDFNTLHDIFPPTDHFLTILTSMRIIRITSWIFDLNTNDSSLLFRPFVDNYVTSQISAILFSDLSFLFLAHLLQNPIPVILG